jgi:hypothetical protein
MIDAKQKVNSNTYVIIFGFKTWKLLKFNFIEFHPFLPIWLLNLEGIIKKTI